VVVSAVLGFSAPEHRWGAVAFAVVLGLASAAQLVRPQAARLRNALPCLDVATAVALMWVTAEDPRRYLFGFLMLALIEVALVLGGRAAVAAWAVAVMAYLPTELPAFGQNGSVEGASSRVVVALILTLGVRWLISELDGQTRRLAASNHRYAELARNFPGGAIVLFDRDLRFEVADGTGLGYHGLSSDRMVGRTPYDLFPHDVIAQIESQYRDVFRGLASTRKVEWGGRVYLSKVVALHDGDGNAMGMGVTLDITEAERAERSVRESERRLRDVLQNVDLLATITDLDGRVLYVNRALSELTGLTEEQLLGQGWVEELSSDEDVDVVEYFYSELRAGRIVDHDENSIRRPDGDSRLIAWSNTILRNADGSIYGAASIGADITEERRRQLALRDSEERFRILSTHAPVGIFQTDTTGACQYVNERWCEIAGMSPGEAMGEGWTKVMHPEEKEQVRAGWYRALAEASSFSMELRYRAPDGRVTWVSANAVPLLGQDGRLQGHIGTVVDISEQKFAAEAIADSERTLRTVTDNMTDVIFVYGMDRRLQYVTPSFEKLTGFSVDVLRERNILGDVHPDDHPRMLSLWRGLFVGEPYTGAEFRITNQDGTEKWCWSAGQPVYDADGVQIGVQIRDADITSRKRAELRVRESEERARSIIESTNEAFVAGDPDGTVLEWNPAAEGIFGWERDDVLGQHLAAILAAPAAQAELVELLRSAAESETHEGEVREFLARRRDGTEFPVEVTLWTTNTSFNMFVRDITARKLREEKVTFMAYHDRLTGLPNRAMFDQHLDLVLARARHDGGAAALLFMDIDRFKHVNDTLGHEAGDELLRQVGERLRRAARNSDLVVRLGGDELAIVLSDLECETAVSIAETVARRVQSEFSAPFDLGGMLFQTSASIGIAIHPVHATDGRELVSAADRAMYASKRAGDGGYAFASPRSDAEAA
jgi:diguanylate cyclase (GGDEF)-like protein/PAS domain S-box-containing protein